MLWDCYWAHCDRQRSEYSLQLRVCSINSIHTRWAALEVTQNKEINFSGTATRLCLPCNHIIVNYLRSLWKNMIKVPDKTPRFDSSGLLYLDYLTFICMVHPWDPLNYVTLCDGVWMPALFESFQWRGEVGKGERGTWLSSKICSYRPKHTNDGSFN